MTGHRKSLWIFSLFVANLFNQITSAAAAYSDFEDSNEDDWRPVFHDVAPSPHSPRRYPLFSQVYTVPATALRPAATKKAYLQVLSNANKVESYSPPSILGPLSDFGHSTVKGKRPILLNKTHAGSLPSINQNPYDQSQPSQNQPVKLPVRYENLGYSAALLPPPVLPSATPYRPDSQEADTQESVNQQYQSYRDAAFLLKTVRPPPPVEHSYRFGSPSATSQNSFFFSNNVPQSQGLSAYHLPTKDNQKSQATNYNSPFLIGGQSPYGPPSPVYPVVLRPAISSIHHQNLGEQYVIRPQSHVKNNEEAVLKRRPVTLYSGDVNANKNLLSPEVLGNAKRPDNTESPLTPTKSPGKQVFDQLAHYARPFQPNNHRDKEEQGKPFISSHQFNIPNGHRLNWNNGSKQKTKGQVFGLGTIGTNPVHSNSYESEKSYAAQSQSPSVYPASVTTIDISAASPESVTFVPYTDSQKDSFRPSHYYFQSTTARPQSSENNNNNYVYNKNNIFSTSSSHINAVSEEEEYPTFLPTPTSDLRPFTFHAGQGQAVSGYTLESSFQKGKNKYTQDIQENNSQVDAVTKTPEFHRRRRPTAATKAPVQYVDEQFTPPETDYPQTDQQDTEAPTVVTYTEPTTTARSRRRKPTQRYRVKPSQEEIPSINFNHEISNSDFNGQNIFTQFVDYSTNPPDTNSNSNSNNNHNYNANNNIYGNNNQNYPSAEGSDSNVGYENGENSPDDSENYSNNVKNNEAEPSTTTTTTTAAPTTPTSRIRNRFKYGNNTRPRFSVKDYKEKLKVTSTSAPETTDNVDDMNERKEILKTRFATRNRLSSKQDSSVKNATDGDLKSELPAKKYKPRVRPSRLRTTSTQSILESLSTTTTTERTSFKPSSTPSRYKNGVSKYYSRYRTSTEAPAPNSSDTQSSSSAKNPVKLKGVFSAKRRPFPLKNAASQAEESKNDENETPNATRGDEVSGGENEVGPQVTKKADNFVISSHNLKGEESFISPEVATKPLDDVSMEYDDEEEEDNAAATKVADLTSSSSNLKKQPIQNEVSSTNNNRRTLPRITIATDDPILPIEAFFQSSRPNKSDRIHR